MTRFSLRTLLWVLLFIGVPSAALTSIATGQTQVYFFTMEGCGPCTQMEPAIDLLLEKGYPIKKIDARLQQAWAQQFEVTSTPTTILVVNNQVVRRESGILDAATIADWCNHNRPPANLPIANSATPITSEAKVAERRTQNDRTDALVSSDTELDSLNNEDHLNDTVRVGTRTPGTQAEIAAMRSTVRIRLEEDDAFSFATGTVIHSHGDEALVLTCGHIFRDSQGRGTITAEINWLDDNPIRVPGKLVRYDAGANDIGLIIIKAGFELPSVRVADQTLRVSPRDPIFSIGCDLGDSPTIRRSTIKNLATYDGSQKYDIVGRPVVGRSGGGLFTSSGILIGVCNAAAVEVDEGVYSSIDNIHTEIGNASLAHLFLDREGDTAIASTNRPAPSAELLALSQHVASSQHVNQQAIGRAAPPAFLANSEVGQESRVPAATNVALDKSLPPLDSLSIMAEPSELEAVVVIRSRRDPNSVKTIIVDQVTPEFLKTLEQPNSATEPRALELGDLARIRREMPTLTQGSFRSAQETVRGQSIR